MLTSYADFIADRESRATVGHPVASGLDLAPHLFDHQRMIVQWALDRGRACIFADTGLGKTAMQVEWARHVATHGRVLILAPLAVAEQTVAEARRFDVEFVGAELKESYYRQACANLAEAVRARGAQVGMFG